MVMVPCFYLTDYTLVIHTITQVVFLYTCLVIFNVPLNCSKHLLSVPLHLISSRWLFILLLSLPIVFKTDPLTNKCKNYYNTGLFSAQRSLVMSLTKATWSFSCFTVKALCWFEESCILHPNPNEATVSWKVCIWKFKSVAALNIYFYLHIQTYIRNELFESSTSMRQVE